MPAIFSKYRYHQIGTTVDDLRMISEVRYSVDHAEQLDYSLDAAEITECLLQHGNQVDAGQPGVHVGLRNRYRVADLASEFATVGFHGSLA